MSPDRGEPAARATAAATAVWGELGRTIRDRRRERGLTLVALASATSLSQPFLSQVENGRARPSMASLHRIAEALGTTPQALFAGPARPSGALVTRGVTAASLPVEGDGSGARCRVLLPGDAPFHVLELDALTQDFHDHWSHDGFEAVYVVAGEVEADVGGELTRLCAGDVLSYPARLPHRHRAVGPEAARILLIETKVEALQDRRPSSHAPVRRARRAVAH